MTKIELAEKAINFAMRDLCGGYLDMQRNCKMPRLQEGR